MGWDSSYGWTSALDVRMSVAADYVRSGFKVLGSAGGRAHWLVIEKDGKRFIAVSLIEKRHGSWWRKDMDESVFPFYFDCPLKFLDMVPEVASEPWRAKVREYHAQRAVRRVLTRVLS